jgi:hypothetical protein
MREPGTTARLQTHTKNLVAVIESSCRMLIIFRLSYSVNDKLLEDMLRPPVELVPGRTN